MICSILDSDPFYLRGELCLGVDIDGLQTRFVPEVTTAIRIVAGVSFQFKSSKRIQGSSIYDLESKFKDFSNSRCDILPKGLKQD